MCIVRVPNPALMSEDPYVRSLNDVREPANPEANGKADGCIPVQKV